MNCTRTRLLAAGFVLSLTAAVVGWTLYFLERQRVDALTSQVSVMEQEAAMLRQIKEAAKVDRANFDMRLIEYAAKSYYLKNAEWPTRVEQLIPDLEKGQKGLIDPWGHFYGLRIEQYEGSDGAMRERPIIYSQSPGGEPRARWPAK